MTDESTPTADEPQGEQEKLVPQVDTLIATLTGISSVDEDSATKPKKTIDDSVQNRRLIERLSGWRLIAFFISAFVNLGLLFILDRLPWMFNQSQMSFAYILVIASHVVFLLAVTAFRLSISIKLALGLAHAVACAWAMESVGGLPEVFINGTVAEPISTLYLIPMLTLPITAGAILVSRFFGQHCGLGVSMRDNLIVFTAIVILIPILMQVVPRRLFVHENPMFMLKTTLPYALVVCGWSLVVANAYLKFLPSAEVGKTHLHIVVGWFLLTAIVSLPLAKFGAIAAVWIGVSLIPISRADEI